MYHFESPMKCVSGWLIFPYFIYGVLGGDNEMLVIVDNCTSFGLQDASISV